MGHKLLDLKKLKYIGQNPNYNVQVYLAALEYIQCGFFIVPIVPDGKALPRKEMGVSYIHATRSKRVIESWYDPDIGKFKGFNIGLACGKKGGIFALDVDMHGLVNGKANLLALEQEFGFLPESPVQKTPNGGEHFIFQWQPNATNTTGKISSGIDTRGGEDNLCKGHIVAWPSKVEGNQYEWFSGGEIPEIPTWVMNKMGILWRPDPAGRGNENVGDEDYEVQIPKEQITRMLEHIPINEIDYEDWLKVGMAIKSQYPDEDGLQLWNEWSSEGVRYESNECGIRWKGFSRQGTVRAGTLFFHAKENGYKVDKSTGEVNGNKYSELVARMNTEFAIVSVGGKIRILRIKEPEHEMMMHYDLMDKESFRTLLQNELMVVLINERPKNISIADIWLSHEMRLTYPNGMGLYPTAAPAGYFNTWNGFTVEPRGGNCELFLEHIKKIVCGDNSYINEWVLDWLADLVQFPDEPKGCAIVMRGGEGIGKGTFANTMGEIFGCHFRHLIDDSHLTNNFNAHLMDAILVFADEITWGGNKKTAGKLKGMITEKYLVGERKGIDALLYRNMIHLLIASNGEWLVPAGADSRRWLVLDVQNTVANNVKYFDAMREELNRGGKEAILHLLLNREIKSNLRHAPETDALQEQRELSTQDDTIKGWWLMATESGRLETADAGEFNSDNSNNRWPEHVEKVELFNEYEEWCLKRKFRIVSMNMFFKKLTSTMGFRQKRINVNGGRKRVYLVPSLKNINREEK